MNSDLPITPAGRPLAPDLGRRVTKTDMKHAHVGGSLCRCGGTGEIEMREETGRNRDSLAAHVVGRFLCWANDVPAQSLAFDPRTRVVVRCQKAMKAFVKKHGGQFVNTEEGPRWLKMFEPKEERRAA